MVYEHQQIVEQLSIDIDLFFQNLEETTSRQRLSDRDKEIIGRSLLGYRRKQIAEAIHLCSTEVGNRLCNNIYPRIARLMQVEQAEIANQWVLILNFLLNPANGYRLNPAPQLNSDNFQGSFGRQVFLYPSHQGIVKSQIKATQRYQQGRYYEALFSFAEAWSEEKKIYGKGNPEICIYINNCLIESRKAFLQQRDIKVYTLAVVVPFHHNQGAIATEILRGVAQIQSIVNFQHFNLCDLDANFFDRESSDFQSQTLFSICGRSTPISCGKIALQIMVVNDPNNVYAPYNQTAEKLANLADEINLIAVIGHYSSEMTQTALNFYAEKGIVLINAFSTSNHLSNLDDTIGFFRTTTEDSVNAAQLVRYLAETLVDRPKTVAIIYNKNSSYSCSYRDSIKDALMQYQFELESEYGQLGGEFQELQNYLDTIQDRIDVIILIPDGGIEPNSLNNTGLISRLNLKKCVIAGSATFYQENVLHWMQERSKQRTDDSSQLIACIPWHWDSDRNGCNTSNSLSQQFCEVGSLLWGEGNLTWRSATAFDAVLMLLKALERYSDGDELIVKMRQLFKVQRVEVRGVTGLIKFQENGDRISPPAEIVKVAQDKLSARWKWEHLKSMT